MNRGDILREKRKKKGCTQAVAAKGTKVALRSYVSYENGKEPRDKTFWARAAKFFDCDVEDFGVSISEDDAYDSYSQADRRASAKSAAMLATGSTLFIYAIGGLPLAAVSLTLFAASFGAGMYSGYKDAMKEAENEDAEAMQLMIEKHERFIRAAKGVIYTALIDRGIRPLPEEPPEDGPDEVIAVDSGVIKSWWLCFEEGITDKEDPKVTIINEVRANALLARFWNFPSDPTRKVSVVVEDERLFYELMAKRNVPYRGNLSAILVDTEDVRLVREEYLATYEAEADENSLMRIATNE